MLELWRKQQHPQIFEVSVKPQFRVAAQRWSSQLVMCCLVSVIGDKMAESGQQWEPAKTWSKLCFSVNLYPRNPMLNEPETPPKTPEGGPDVIFRMFWDTEASFT